jgi:8-oxo-dGTP pyrophosphatase MutT (NUDIX family)
MSEAIPAATVVLARDSADGLEVLMLRKNADLAFGGMWVFPGGRVDPDDGDGEEGARNAAVREALEEADLLVEPDGLVPFAHWSPPAVAPKRFATWFFLAPAPSGAVSIDGGEIHDHVWVEPGAALARHAAREIELAPPTWVTLHRLSGFADLRSALDDTAARQIEIYETHIGKGADGVLAAMWLGDAGYESGDLDAEGARHRLWMRDDGWVYEKDVG